MGMALSGLSYVGAVDQIHMNRLTGMGLLKPPPRLTLVMSMIRSPPGADTERGRPEFEYCARCSVQIPWLPLVAPTPITWSHEAGYRRTKSTPSLPAAATITQPFSQA